MTLVELGAWLQTKAVVTVGTDCFLGQLPAAPVTCTALYEVPGGTAMRSFGNTVEWERPGLEVRVRGVDYQTGRELIERVYQALLGLANDTLTGTFWAEAEPQTPPYLDERDPDGRPIFAFRVGVAKALSMPGN